jgi:hypothetical protein
MDIEITPIKITPVEGMIRPVLLVEGLHLSLCGRGVGWYLSTRALNGLGTYAWFNDNPDFSKPHTVERHSDPIRAKRWLGTDNVFLARQAHREIEGAVALYRAEAADYADCADFYEVERVGKLICGSRWKSEFCRIIGTQDSHLSEWKTGSREVPDRVMQMLPRLLDEHLNKVQLAQQRLRGYLAA